MIAAIRSKRNVAFMKVATRPITRQLKLLTTNLQPIKYFYNKTNFPLRKFKPKHKIFYATENFILKTADTPFELRQVLKLRHEIFYKELQNKELESNLDIDDFDLLCDHLIIIDKKSSKVVGTYRLISSQFSNKFYSQGEFTLDAFLAAPGNKLELGRACIHKDYRNGAMISLLWRGIIAYVKITNSQYLFGCASVQTMDPLLASEILEYLRANHLSSEEFHVSPTVKYTSDITKPLVSEQVAEKIPALLHSYIKAGAKFYGLPACDRDFDCYDFFMILKIEDLSKIFRRKYGL